MIKVLVTNDDGISAKGISELVAALSSVAEVYVAAPADQQSAKSHSVTFLREVSAEETEMEGAVWAYAIDGTPVDCVKWGLGKLASEGIFPDYVFSGINHGHNLGMSAYYSGTIAAAREGAINGVRSIALSVGSHNEESSNNKNILDMLPQIMEMSDRIRPSTLLSVNAPDIPSWDIKGVRVVPAAPYGFGEHFSFHRAESGNYQLGVRPAQMDVNKRYDYDWMEKGYVTVSPISTSLDDPVALRKLRQGIHTADALAVIIDAQDDNAKGMRKPKRFRRNISRFVHAFSRMDLPLLIVNTYGSGDTFIEVRKHAGNAEYLEKIFPDAWTVPDLEKLVPVIETARVLIAGAATNVAVLQTAAGFIERGYDVTIIEDSCTASTKADHSLAIEELKDMGCRITTSETVIMQLAATRERTILESVKEILSK